MPRKCEFQWLLALGTLALMIRLLAIFFVTPGNRTGPFDYDSIYRDPAVSLASKGIYARFSDYGNRPLQYLAWRPPLFPLFLAAMYRLYGFQSNLIQRYYFAVLSLLVPLGTWWLARRLWSPSVGLAAFAGACFHPAFIHYAVYLQCDSFFLIFSTWAMALMTTERTHFQTIIAGLLTGIACLGRSQFIGAMLIGLGWALLKPKPTSRRIWAIGYLAAFLVIVTPWWVRNYRVFHRFVPFSTEGGCTLWVGNNPLADGGGLCPPSYFPANLDEIQRDQWHYEQALAYIFNNPRRTASLALSKLARFWGVVPRVGSRFTKIVAAGAYIPMFGFAAAALWIWRRRMREFLPILALAAYYSLTQTIFPSVMRYRLPLEPLLIALASAGALHLLPLFKSSRAR